jgi:hypothetical protein
MRYRLSGLLYCVFGVSTGLLVERYSCGDVPVECESNDRQLW